MIAGFVLGAVSMSLLVLAGYAVYVLVSSDLGEFEEFIDDDTLNEIQLEEALNNHWADEHWQSNHCGNECAASIAKAYWRAAR